MLIMGIIVFCISLGSAAIGGYGLAGLFGELPGALIGFFSFFLPGIYFLYQNRDGGTEEKDQQQERRSP